MRIRSYNAVIKTLHRLNKAQVIESCGISDGKYSDHQFETGISWIKEKLWDDEGIVSMISCSPVFWDWFINEWNKREDDFIMNNLERILDNEPKHLMLDSWLEAHSTAKLHEFPKGKKWEKLISSVIKNAGREVVNA